MAVGPSTTQTPYLVPSRSNVQITSILSVGDQVGAKEAPSALAGQPYVMVGIADGLGAFDNGDGTITVLLNHELSPTLGLVREHGSTGAFVSKWIIDKTTLEVLDGSDLVQDVFIYDPATDTFTEGTTAFARLCSADLPDISAFYDSTTGLGTTDRIFMNGEETGNEGRAFAHIVTGAEAGDTYQLPHLGRFSWENSLANPASGEKTVVIGLDDSTPGELYLYAGDKRATGNAVEKAGLIGGSLYGVLAAFGDDTTSTPAPTTFSLVAQGTDGDVSDLTGAQLQAASSNLTQFGRPEDGAWDPSNPNRFYFLTTGTATQPTRLWEMLFKDASHPELGGTIRVVIEGVFPNSDPNSSLPLMLDNMTVTENGQVFMQEDPGNNARLAKVWMYDPFLDNGVDANSGLTEIAHHDASRFAAVTAGTARPAPGGFFNQDEESSGVIDVTSIIGGDRISLMLDTQAHYQIDTDPLTAGVQGELVEGGQLQLLSIDIGNAGKSKYKGGKGVDQYDGGFGNDDIKGAGGADILAGSYGNDKIEGGDGDDKVSGGSGDDTLQGGKGNDAMIGGAGDDKIAGGADADTIDGEIGNDRIDGEGGSDTLRGGLGNDVIRGGSQNDTLRGDQGNDDLRADDGDDRLQGGSGIDLLDGGKGRDTFVFDFTDGDDIIKRFDSVDDQFLLDLAVTAENVTFVGFVESQTGNTNAVLTYSQASGKLFFDATGGTNEDQVLLATIQNKSALHINDVDFGSFIV